MKTGYAVSIFLLSVVALMVLNLGRILDVTESPTKSDVIVCLGGGTVERVKKSVQLLQEGYSERNVFLLMGESWYNRPYIAKHFPDVNVTVDEAPENTLEEVLAVKTFMRKHGYRSAVIVTDPPHTRRVRLLLSLTGVGGGEAMTFRVVGTEAEWWDRAHYFTNARARQDALYEAAAIAHALLLYGIDGEKYGR